jgi:hypothetical protein
MSDSLLIIDDDSNCRLIRSIAQSVEVRPVRIRPVASPPGGLGQDAGIDEDLHGPSRGGLGGLEEPLNGTGGDDRMPGQELEEPERCE